MQKFTGYVLGVLPAILTINVMSVRPTLSDTPTIGNRQHVGKNDQLFANGTKERQEQFKENMVTLPLHHYVDRSSAKDGITPSTVNYPGRPHNDPQKPLERTQKLTSRQVTGYSGRPDKRFRFARHHEGLYPGREGEDRVEMSVCHNSSDHTFTECLHEKCISPEGILHFYNLSHDGMNSITSYQPDIPIDVLRLVQHFCFHQTLQPLEVETKNGPRHKRSTPTEAWGYGVGFVAVINCISMVGAVLVPIMDKPFYKKTIMMLVALAVGAMAGTSIFVLIPEAFDLMNIEETAHKYKWKCTTIVGALYLFYVWEQAMRLHSSWKRIKAEKKKRKIEKKEEEEMLHLEKGKIVSEKGSLDIEIEDNIHSHSHGMSGDGEVATVAWIVLIADGIHKFVDGLSIGASFANSVVTGISVSVAILCEELPHELGDIAILIHSGMKMKKALLYNLLVSLPCFVGLALGILLTGATSADKWIFALAGGVFMYIALVDMLPEIRTADERDPEFKTMRSKVTLSVLQNTGLLIGFMIIFILVSVF